MKVISAFTNQNFNFEKPEKNSELRKIAGKNISLWDIKETHKEISLISFWPQKHSENDDRQKLVLAVDAKQVKKENSSTFEDVFYVRTGLYAGRISYGGVTFDIKPDCSDALYERMLNFANHIYIDKSEEKSQRKKDNKFPLIEYLFLSSLQRVSVLGFPQEYSKQNYHDLNIHGGLDIQTYIKKDIPFTGMLSSRKNERCYVQSIVDVLYCALNSCRNEIKNNFKRLSLIKNELRASYSGRFPSQQTFQNAQTHRVLNNPMFAGFKQTLKFAEIVIKHNTIVPNAKTTNAMASGYLLDIASLWEVYLEHLIKSRLEDWNVSTQEELKLYKDCFFRRENRPDFVLRKKDGNGITILDAKFKRMDGVYKEYSDVDREDFFQIHSYAGYYREKGIKNIHCGLIYPLSKKKLDKNSANLYGLTDTEYIEDSSKTRFIVEGIYKGLKKKDDNSGFEDDAEYSVTVAEDAFIDRLREFLAS